MNAWPGGGGAKAALVVLGAVAAVLVLVGGELARTRPASRPSASTTPSSESLATGTDAGTGTSASATTTDSLVPASFVAFSNAFEDFRTWERIPVDGAMLPVGAAPGPTAVYVSARTPEGSARWPVGTILVKAIEHEALEDWVIHAMVKRGVPYNRDGAIGWEFFELGFEPDSDRPHVVWRGTGPPSGHGYAAQGRDAGTAEVPLVCNDCHAVAWQSDGALTPELAFARR
jgi:hypothetical protein